MKRPNFLRARCASIVSVGTAAALLLSAPSALPREVSAKDSDHFTIVAEIFPTYDWTRELLSGVENDASLHLLLANGVDLHSYQPSVDDILTIADSDLLIYVGGETDGWIEDALKEAPNPDRQVINLMDLLTEEIKEEEIVEGMNGEAHEEHASPDAEDEIEYDEHVWLSLKNASIVTDAICDALIAADPSNEEQYSANCAAYQADLSALDQAYEKTVSAASLHTVLFGDRFPFRYLTDDYDLTYYAAFAGCSAESEASFETIAFLANKVNELGLPAILTIEGPDHRIAETIAANTKTPDMPILTMDSMQATTLQDSKDGVTYLSLMEQNRKVLEQALTV